MAFVRKRQGGGKYAWKEGSHQLVESYREGGKVRQRQIANMGPWNNVTEAVEGLERHVDRLQEHTHMWDRALDEWQQTYEHNREEYEKWRAEKSIMLMVAWLRATYSPLDQT